MLVLLGGVRRRGVEGTGGRARRAEARTAELTTERTTEDPREEQRDESDPDLAATDGVGEGRIEEGGEGRPEVALYCTSRGMVLNAGPERIRPAGATGTVGMPGM